MTIPTPGPDPTRSDPTQTHPRDDQDDLVDVDVEDDLPDDGSRKRAEEIDELTQDHIGLDALGDLPPGTAL